MSTSKFKSVWDALIDDPDEDLKKRSDYLILIQARLHGMSGSEERKAELIGISLANISDIMKGHVQSFSLNELQSVARKAGVTFRP